MPHSELISLNELIDKSNSKKLIIPLLQRNYKWSTENASQLLADIRKAKCKKQNEYTIGMATFYNCGTDDIQVIDGQQRIITLCLLAKALGKIAEFLKISFERDEDQQKGLRYNYLYGNNSIDSTYSSVDVKRMEEVFNRFNKMLSEENKEKNDSLYGWICEHVKIIYRETDNTPLNEFLNLNENKISFSPSDYDRAYQLKYQSEKQEDMITPAMILKEHSLIEKYLYTNEDVYNLIKSTYTKNPSNRMDLLFENSSFGSNIQKYYAEIDSKPDEKNNRYTQQYEYLKYCRKVLKSICDELQKQNNSELNVNIYNAVILLSKLKENFKFFDLINIDETENFEEKLFKTFCPDKDFSLLDQTYKAIKNKNAFMESQLKNKLDNPNDSEIDRTTFNNIYSESQETISGNINNWFEDREKEVIDIIQMGKNVSELSNSTTKSFEEILRLKEIEEIIIPEIQRDYTFGSQEENVKKLLFNISSTYLDSFINEHLQDDCYEIGSSEKIIYNSIKNNKKLWPEPPKSELNANNFLKTIITGNDNNKKLLEFSGIKYDSGEFDFRRNEIKNKFSNILNSFKQELNIKTFKYIKNNEENNDNRLYFENTGEIAFPFGIILCFLEDHRLYIYDGQQRLVTLVFLCAYIIIYQNKTDDDEYRELLKKFKFENRKDANDLLSKLLNASEKSPDLSKNSSDLLENIFPTDHTTYSIIKLLKLYRDYENGYNKKILCFDLEYLMKKIKFEFAIIDKTSTVEQLYMDLNTNNVLLSTAENYKAELVHKLNSRFNDSFNKYWKYQLDNCFLNQAECENLDECENLEMKIIHWCFKMAALEYDISISSSFEDSDRLSWIDDPNAQKIIDCVGGILNTKLKFRFIKILKPWEEDIIRQFVVWHGLRSPNENDSDEKINYSDDTQFIKVRLSPIKALDLAKHIFILSKSKDDNKLKTEEKSKNDLNFLVKKYHSYWEEGYLEAFSSDREFSSSDSDTEKSSNYLDYFSEQYLENKLETMEWIEYIYYIKLNEIKNSKYFFVNKWEKAETTNKQPFKYQEKKFAIKQCGCDYDLWCYIKDKDFSINKQIIFDIEERENNIDIDSMILSKIQPKLLKNARMNYLLYKKRLSIPCKINYGKNNNINNFIKTTILGAKEANNYLIEEFSKSIQKKYYIEKSTNNFKIYGFNEIEHTRTLLDSVSINKNISFTVEELNNNNILKEKIRDLKNTDKNLVRYIWGYKKETDDEDFSNYLKNNIVNIKTNWKLLKEYLNNEQEVKEASRLLAPFNNNVLLE